MFVRRIGVIADDLTGAADTTLAFWQRGFETFILLDGIDKQLQDGNVVVAIDTDSRHVSGDESAVRVTDAVHRLRMMGINTLYKKIDSTVRGNIGAEIEAALQAADVRCAVVCPAFPVMGRSVAGGRVLVNGLDLMETSVANDPRRPVTSSRIADLLAQQTSLPIEELSVTDLLQAEGTVGIVNDEMRIIVVDAESEADLRGWVRRFGVGSDVLWVGSAGLADILAGEMHVSALRDVQQMVPALSFEDKAVLVVAGSVHSASREQIAVLCASPQVTALAIDPAALLEGTLDIQSLVTESQQALARGKHCVLYTEHSPEVTRRLRRVLDRLQRDYEWSGGAIAHSLSKIVATILSSVHRPVDLVLTGGDTARPTLIGLGVRVLRVVQMAASGTPVCETLDGQRRVVTKAGGFGNADILVQAVNALMQY